jgi:hypothetical protein
LGRGGHPVGSAVGREVGNEVGRAVGQAGGASEGFVEGEPDALLEGVAEGVDEGGLLVGVAGAGSVPEALAEWLGAGAGSSVAVGSAELVPSVLACVWVAGSSKISSSSSPAGHAR